MQFIKGSTYAAVCSVVCHTETVSDAVCGGLTELYQLQWFIYCNFQRERLTQLTSR
jgi:hypothetical protein